MMTEIIIVGCFLLCVGISFISISIVHASMFDFELFLAGVLCLLIGSVSLHYREGMVVMWERCVEDVVVETVVDEPPKTGSELPTYRNEGYERPSSKYYVIPGGK